MNNQITTLASMLHFFLNGGIINIKGIQQRWSVSRATAYRNLNYLQLILGEIEMKDYAIENINGYYVLSNGDYEVQDKSKATR